MNPPAPDQDTIAWLLTTNGCPYCGAAVGAQDERCPICRRELVAELRGDGATTFVTLAGAWGLAAAVTTLMAIGAWLQLTGRMSPPKPEPPHPLLTSLAYVLRIRAIDAPVAAPPPPAWFVPVMALAAVGALTMAWGCAAHRGWALTIGIGLSIIPALLGLAGALYLSGVPGLVPLVAGVLISAVLVLIHLGAGAQLQGERVRIGTAPSSSSAIGLFQEGRAAQQRGMNFLAAQHWARAVGKNPTDPTYLHALALALAHLGLHERAGALIDRALRAAPDDPRIRASAELLHNTTTTRRHDDTNTP